ncbi:5' nucleotidase, NT5C type [Solimicrobium silvestre]|uniref:5' nucleotidase, deoxy (Pyrimidine), cytosolic type C protein (NT5C) n=1 Tax=Solimicrobium silvestre TaxID=2099400 RepID=A0A2S9GX72_9BURK|nr:phosphate acetyltransferase [Solimicrobium silvestre]PRC92308.1 5' nucleotidase, deoxy (Pyrimidine), cytosolic type C protein (NT5C) [Solimicrobium silvestre]
MKKYNNSFKQRSGSIIALDADGVLLDYNAAYRLAWERAFGLLPDLRDKNAYWAIDRWDVSRLDGMELIKFRACFDEQYWKSIPAIPNAVKACEELCSAGYELVCVSAIESQFQHARLQNLQECGFPIERVIATSGSNTGISPKAAALRELNPIAFVDDFLPYLRGIPDDIHAALIMREPNGSPNLGGELNLAHSLHPDLQAFASWWLSESRCVE